MHEPRDPTPLLHLEPGSHWLPPGITGLQVARRADSLLVRVNGTNDELAGWFRVRSRPEIVAELREWLVGATRSLGAGPASAIALAERVIELLAPMLPHHGRPARAAGTTVASSSDEGRPRRSARRGTMP